LAKILDESFDNYSIPQRFENYCLIIEKIFNQNDDELKKFAFRIFDMNKDKKLSQKDMFDLMHSTSSQHTKNYLLKPDEQKTEEQKNHFYEILPLGKQRDDLFMDVFSKDYIKILK